MPPSEIFVRRATSAAAAWIFALLLLQRIRGTASSTVLSRRRDRRLEVTSPERGDCLTSDRAARQTRKEHYRSRRAPLLRFHSLALARRCSASCSGPLLPCHPTTAKRRSLSTRSGERVRRHFFHWSCGSRLRGREFLGRGMLAATRAPHQCRRGVTDQLSGEGTAAGKGRSRQDGLGKKIQSSRVERRGVPTWSKKESSPS